MSDDLQRLKDAVVDAACDWVDSDSNSDLFQLQEAVAALQVHAARSAEQRVRDWFRDPGAHNREWNRPAMPPPASRFSYGDVAHIADLAFNQGKYEQALQIIEGEG